MGNNKQEQFEFNNYEMVHTCGEYSAHPCNDKSSKDVDFVIETGVGKFNEFNDGPISIKVYSKGEIKDLQIGKWTVSPIVKGTTHFHGSYDRTIFKVNCIDPSQNPQTLELQQPEFLRYDKLAKTFFNRIQLLTYFQTASEFVTAYGNLFTHMTSVDDLTNNIIKYADLVDFFEKLEKQENDDTIQYFKRCLSERLHDLKCCAEHKNQISK